MVDDTQSMSLSLQQPAGRKQMRLIIAAAAIPALLVLQAHFRLALVTGDSMSPTLKSGDVMLLHKRAYAQAEPRRGDIVVARAGEALVVKRIVGLSGEELEVRLGKLYINGTEYQEDYAFPGGFLEVGRGKLLEGDFATLGDNRAIASALAIHPIICKDDIVGRVVWSWRPFRSRGPKVLATVLSLYRCHA